MFSPLLASLLAAVSPPRAPTRAELIVHVPRLDELKGVISFFEAAGKHATILSPSSWRSEFHPLLDLDLTRTETLARAGIDPASAATVSFIGNDRMTCTTLRDPQTFRARCAERLAAMGEPWTAKAQDATMHGAASGGRVIAGYALRGRQVCAAASAKDAEPLLKEAAAILGSLPTPGRWKPNEWEPKHLYVILRHFIIGVDGSGKRLSLAGRTLGVSSPRLSPTASSPYAHVSPSGLLFVRAHVEASGVNALAASLLSQLKPLCPECDERQLQQLISTTAENLTGNLLLRADGARLRAPLRTPSAQYFALKHAYVAEVSRPEDVKKALERASDWRSARKTSDGFALSVQGGEVQIGLRGTQLYIGNDSNAVNRALESLSTRRGKLEHGADLSLDPRQVARTLSQISLLEAMTSRELAPMLAISAELGPLLDASHRVTGWADTRPDGEQRFALTWTLLP